MANLNRVMLIGRLTREPETREFSNGGRVANIGFAVNNLRRNQASGAWERVPVWVDLKAFNRETGRKLADLAAKSLHKGNQVYVEGHLVREEWAGKEDGKKQSRTVVYVDNLEFLEKRVIAAAGEGGDGGAEDGGAVGAEDGGSAAAPAPAGRAPKTMKAGKKG